MTRRLLPPATALLLLISIGGGCAYQPIDSAEAKPSRSDAPANTQRVLRVEGTSVILGEATVQPLSAQALLDRVGILLSSTAHYAANDLLSRYPDLAREALLDSALARHAAAPAVAAWLDQRAAPARGGWALLIADRSQNPARYAGYDQQRRALWAGFRKGDFAAASGGGLRALGDGPTPWPEIDAAVLRGTALLASGKPDEAAPRFEEAAAGAAGWDPVFADRQWLFAALAYRMAGQPVEAQRIEQWVSSLAPSRLAQVHDPMILRLALKTAVKSPAPFSPEAASARVIHARLGELELKRGSPQAALLNYRAAESQPGASPRTAELRLKQAEALITLRQEQPALVMLAGLAKGEARPEALVMLGLIHLRRNEIETGLAMLQEAVRLTTAESHPQIYADAGLSLLSAGQREPGMRLLHRSRGVYQQRGDFSAVRQSLINELRYAQATGDTDLARQVRGQLTASRWGP
ncbi:MAG: hypothetical protein AAGI68_00165 [Planctomycetota bacterium]